MPRSPTTFVLVHGAWAGGWAWTRVVERLINDGHRVFAPTLSGLGERAHLARSGIDLSVHVSDVVNEVLWKDLDRIVLVGHSYGGLVITGAAEKVAERIASIVYVDAFIPGDGESFSDLVPGFPLHGELIDAPPTAEGDYRSEADRAWVDRKATPQPVGTFTEKLRVTGAYQRISKKTYIQATGWAGSNNATAARLRSDPTWMVYEVDCGHDVAIDAPRELVDILEACNRRRPNP